MKVRRGEFKDIPRMLDLLTQVNLVHHEGRPDIFNKATKYDAEMLREEIETEKLLTFVAVDESDYVLGYGFCMMEQVIGDRILTDIKTLYIDDICVDETCRGQHVGSAIYDAIVAFAKEQGCYHITLNVWELNPTARQFYESLGMKPLKTMMETVL